MNNENNNTKQKIQQTALDLFSVRGYSAVSIRDIGRIVGIKESTIYYHFKNKQDIFQALLLEVKDIASRMEQMFNARFEKIIKVEEDAFVQVGLGFLEKYLLDTHINKFIRMLAIEQYVSEKTAVLYQDILFYVPLAQNAAVFKMMMNKEYFRQDDDIRLANEYYGMIFFIFQKYFCSGEVTAVKKDTAKGGLAVHLKRFYDRYKK